VLVHCSAADSLFLLLFAFQVLVRCSVYGVPLYVTETGVSINSQRHRQYMIDSYVKQVCVAVVQIDDTMMTHQVRDTASIHATRHVAPTSSDVEVCVIQCRQCCIQSRYALSTCRTTA
jgi:hypothetical protein